MAGSYYNTGWNNLSSGGGGSMAGGYHFVNLNNTLGGAHGNSGGVQNTGGGANGAGGWGASGSFGAGPGINGLINQQLADNAWARQNNLAEWNQAKNNLLAVPGQYQGDPVHQATQRLAMQMLQNPEAINDRTQQLAINRGSNLINAASNSRLSGMMGDAAVSGQLGSSNLQSGYGQIERDRLAQLMGMGSNLEIQRANQRNQDYLNAINMGQSVSGQNNAVNMGVASTYIQNLPQFKADDLSGLIALQGQFSGGGQYGGGGMAGGSMYMNNAPTGGAGQPRLQNAPQLGFGSNWTAPQQEGPSVNPYGAYNNNFQPWTQGGVGQSAGGSLYSNGGNWYTQSSQPIANQGSRGNLGGGSGSAIPSNNSGGGMYNRQYGWSNASYGASGTSNGEQDQGTYLGHGITLY